MDRRVWLVLFTAALGAHEPAPVAPREVTFDVGPGASRVRVHVVGASADRLVRTHGERVFLEALGAGTKLVLREVPGGVEDTLVTPPGGRRELRYRLDLPVLASLRAVPKTGVVEVLDSGGAPRVRMSPPMAFEGSSAARALAVRVEGCQVNTDAAPPWSRLHPAPGARSCDVVVEVPESSRELLIDPLWTTTGNMAVDRTAFLLLPVPSSRVLAVGTAEVTPGDATELWDEATGTWAVTAPLHQGRYFADGVALSDGRILASGGQGATLLASTELFDAATGVWTEVGSMAVARRRHRVAALGAAAVLAAGGDDKLGAPTSSAEVFDVASGTWSGAGPMATPRSDHAMAVLPDGRVLVAGGMKSASSTTRTAEIYDPVPRTFASTSELRLPRTRFALVGLSDGRVLAVGGVEGTAAESDRRATELFDPAAGSWSAGPPLSVERLAPTVALLPGARVLVAGGLTNGGATESVDILLPGTLELAPSEPMKTARANHASVSLGAGRVLLAGGSPDKRSAELFALLPGGAACSAAVACASGRCRDGRCCDTACLEGCRACAKELTGRDDGVCAPVVRGRDPHVACKASNSTCDGSGACVEPAKTACSNDGLTSTGPDGASQSCAPYRCGEAGVCLVGCTTALQCAPGTRCSVEGTCVSAEVLRASDDGGCSIGPRTSEKMSFAFVFVCLLAYGLRILRRRP